MHLAIFSLAVFLNAGAIVVTPDDLDTAFKNIQTMDPVKQAAQVKPVAAKIFTIAHQLESEPVPEGAIEKENYAKRMEWVKEVKVYTEYVLSAAALQAPAPLAIELISMLENQNPKSRYLDTAYGRYLVALTQTGAAAKVPAAAEKALANFPENEDLLLVLADNAIERKQTNNALTYARRLTASLNKHTKPEGMAAADWERKRSAALGRGYWIQGIILGESNQYLESDKTLRAAVPLIKGSDAMLAAAYYYLGLANFQMGKMMLNKAQVLEGVKYSELASRFNGPYAANASHNAQVMKNEASRMR